MSVRMFCLFLLLACLRAQASDEPTNKNFLGIQPYKNDYLLFDSRIIFQFSFKYNLLAKKEDETGRSGLFFAYTQHSYWKQGSGDVGNANPYIYTNFEPEIFYVIPYDQHQVEDIRFGFDHQSDGLGKQFDKIHREWDRYFVEATALTLDGHLKLHEKIWYADITPRYNHDIVKYLGITETHLEANVLDRIWVPKVELTLYKGTSFSGKDISFMFETHLSLLDHESWNFKSPLHLYSQWYRGYGESLQTYRRRTNQFRLGVSALF